jgi:HEAT repeat protein
VSGSTREALDCGDPEVRLWAAYLLGWFPEERGASLPPLVRRLEVEPDPSVAATTAIATGLVAPAADAATWRALVGRLRAQQHVERWAAAIALARMDQLPDRGVVEALYRCVRHAEPLLVHRYLMTRRLVGMLLGSLRSEHAKDIDRRAPPPARRAAPPGEATRVPLRRPCTAGDAE